MPMLFAETDSGLPAGKAIAIMLIFGSVALVSLGGLFASKKTLESMAGVIGTKNPLVARIVCILGLGVGAIGVLVSALSLMGKL